MLCCVCQLAATQLIIAYSASRHARTEGVRICRSLPNYGGFGKGEMQWYALWVLTQREEELGQDLEASISRLGQVKNAEGNLVTRQVESWVPSKMKLKWNNRHAL